MRWLKRWRQHRAEIQAQEEAAMRKRLAAERELRETTERWPTVNEAADAVAELRRSDRDPFLDELAEAMRPRPHRNRREA